MKVAVFGASGFVGATVVEHLLARTDIETRVFIHSFGNAWRLARAAIPMRTVDITMAGDVDKALAGCTHVVNCTRGSGEVMVTGLKNLLSASKANGARRFVHLSSVAVYGDPPPSESEREDVPARPTDSYGAMKLKQDDIVAAASGNGLDCVVLCPPNISGVYSSFLCNVLADMRNGSFALVDGGARPLNTVDVDNLAHAIVLALEIGKGDGKRIFLTDGGMPTWKDLADALLRLAELAGPLPNVKASALRFPPTAKSSSSLWKSVKHLVSSDVREALRRDPNWARFDKAMRRTAAVGGKGFEHKLRHAVEGPIKIEKARDAERFSSRYNALQLRDVRHRINRARDVLGYVPPLDFAGSMLRFCTWYETMYGFGQNYWPLARLLMDFRPQALPVTAAKHA